MVQIFVWTGGSFTLLQTLDFQQDILSVTPFTRATVPYLLVCVDRETVSCFLLQWTSGRFENPQPLQLTGRAIQVETVKTRAEDILLLVVMEGNSSSFDVTGNYWLLLCLPRALEQLLYCLFLFEHNERTCQA